MSNYVFIKDYVCNLHNIFHASVQDLQTHLKKKLGPKNIF